MKLILRDDVANLGKAGDLVTVKNGYGRNFLLPRALAMPATAQNMRQIEHQKAVVLSRQNKLKGEAELVAQKIANTPVTLARRVGEQDKLFGSVTSRDIAEALEKAGLTLERHAIELKEPIKSLGDHEVAVRLHSRVVAMAKVKIVAE